MEVEVPNTERRLKPGMFVRIRIPFEEHPEATVVPVAALVERDGARGVFLADPAAQRVRFVPLTLGIVDSRQAEVLAPPLEGLVVVLGQHLLADGAAVIIASRAPTATGEERPMKIYKIAIQRPVTAVMASLIVVILGGVSLSRLSVDLMPDITLPTLSISTEYENASPEEVEELITRPIEEAMSAVPGVEEVSSVSAEGRSSVRVTFAWGTDLDAAANDLRDRLDRVMPQLPEDVDRPGLRKYDLAAFPILILGVSSDLNPIQLREIIDNQVKNRIERIPGVASLGVWGGLDREIHVNLDAEKIKALEIPLDALLDRLRAENLNLPAGTIEAGMYDVTIRTPGIYNNLKELRDTVVAIREGVAIQLKEIAQVEDSWERVTRIVRINGKPGVRLSVNKQSGKNTVDVAEGV